MVITFFSCIGSMDIARKSFGGLDFRGVFNWFLAYFYACLSFYNRNRVISGVLTRTLLPKYAPMIDTYMALVWFLDIINNWPHYVVCTLKFVSNWFIERYCYLCSIDSISYNLINNNLQYAKKPKIKILATLRYFTKTCCWSIFISECNWGIAWMW